MECTSCQEGYIEYPKGYCYKCEDLFQNCIECGKNEISEIYQCNKCRHPYSLNEYGHCEMCILTESIVNNECITCNDLSKGGIENCKYCQSNEKRNVILCKECEINYILNIDDNTCEKRND